MRKLKIVCRSARTEHQLRLLGANDTWIVSSARILGIDFTAYARASARATAEARADKARMRVRRVQMAPVSLEIKEQLVAYLVTPLAAWGCWLFQPGRAWAAAQKAIDQTLWVYRAMGSPDLRRHLRTTAALLAVTELYNVVASGWAPEWSQRPTRGSWLAEVAACLGQWGVGGSWALAVEA